MLVRDAHLPPDLQPEKYTKYMYNYASMTYQNQDSLDILTMTSINSHLGL